MKTYSILFSLLIAATLVGCDNSSEKAEKAASQNTESSYAGQSASERAPTQAGEAKDAAGQALDAAGNAISSGAASIKEDMKDAAETAKDRAGEAADAVKDQANKAKAATSQMLENTADSIAAKAAKEKQEADAALKK